MKSLWLHHPSNPLLNPEVLLAKQHLLFTETSLTVFAFLFRWSFCCSKEAWSIPDIFSPASWYILVSVFHLNFKRNYVAYRRLGFPYWNFVLWTCISISENCLFCSSLTESLGFAMKPYESKTVFQLNIFLIDTIYWYTFLNRECSPILLTHPPCQSHF